MLQILLQLVSQLLWILALQIFHIDANVGEHDALVYASADFVDYKKDLASFVVHFCCLIWPHLDESFNLGILHYLFNILCQNNWISKV